jgi:hypothetical protein
MKSILLLSGIILALFFGSASALIRAKNTSTALHTQINRESPPLASQQSESEPEATPQSFQALPPPLDYPEIQIYACRGTSINANFRSAPGFDTSIIGVVLSGDSIYLTGQQVAAGGEVWYSAIAATVYPLDSQNQIIGSQTNQSGWVAGCFIHQ